MIHRPWKLRPGPEWQSSLDGADPHDAYFRANIDVARDALATNPWAYSHAFLEARDALRIYQTSDRAAGYNVVIFIEIDRTTTTVELKWVELEHH